MQNAINRNLWHVCKTLAFDVSQGNSRGWSLRWNLFSLVFSFRARRQLRNNWVANTNGSLHWEEYDLDACVQTAFGIKLKLQSQNRWVQHLKDAKCNAANGQHGPSGPPTKPDDNDKKTSNPSTPYTHHWTGKKDLAPREVSILLSRYSCICCCSNSHELTTCPVLSKTYNISYKSSPQQQPNSSTTNNNNSTPTSSNTRPIQQPNHNTNASGSAIALS